MTYGPRCVLLPFSREDVGPLCSRCATNACPRGRGHRRAVRLIDGRVVKVAAGEVSQ